MRSTFLDFRHKTFLFKIKIILDKENARGLVVYSKILIFANTEKNENKYLFIGLSSLIKYKKYGSKY